MKPITQFKRLFLYAVVFMVVIIAQPSSEAGATITNFNETENSLSFDFDYSRGVDPLEYMFFPYQLGALGYTLTYWQWNSTVVNILPPYDEFHLTYATTLHHEPDGSPFTVTLEFTDFDTAVSGSNSIAHGAGFVDEATLMMTMYGSDADFTGFSGSFSASHMPANAVPEPSSMLLLLSGILGLFSFKRVMREKN